MMAAARDIMFIAVILFIIGTALFVTNFVTNTMVNAMVAVPMINSTAPAKQVFLATQTTANTRLDHLFFGLFIALILGILISGYFVGGEPIFMLLYFLVTVIAVIASMMLANVWYDVTTMAVWGVTINYLPITNNILKYLPMYIGIIGTLGNIIMFAKAYAKGNE